MVHRFTCVFVFYNLALLVIDLLVASSRISRVLARFKVNMKLFYLTEQVGMFNLKSEKKKERKKKESLKLSKKLETFVVRKEVSWITFSSYD